MDLPLVLAGLALGVALSPHCAVMCGAPCAALTGGCRSSAGGFHAGRLIGYMAGGALAASSVAALAAWSQASPAFKPLWTLLHLAFLGLGLWWLSTGRHPVFVQRSSAVSVRVVRRGKPALRATLAGLAWVAWPCAALQAALLLSALATTPWGGALVMGGFAIASMPALAVTPWVWERWNAFRGSSASPAQVSTLGLRVAGLGLVLASGWALTHGIWERMAAWCAS